MLITSMKTCSGDNLAGGGVALVLSFMLASMPPLAAEYCQAFITAGIVNAIAVMVISLCDFVIDVNDGMAELV